MPAGGRVLDDRVLECLLRFGGGFLGALRYFIGFDVTILESGSIFPVLVEFS